MNYFNYDDPDQFLSHPKVNTVAPQFRGIPALKGDEYLGPKLDKYGRENAARLKRERRIVWNLIKHVVANGFELDSVYDGGDYVPVKSAKDAMEAIFSVDDSTLRFRHPGHAKLLGVFLVGGNGVDIVSDYSAPNDNVGGWNDVMDAFSPDDYA